MRSGSDVVVGIIGAVGGMIAAGVPAYLTGRASGKRLVQERENERERGFELAQTGYRKAYENFLRNVELAHVGPDGRLPSEDLAELHESYYVARSAGDQDVLDALDRWWPTRLRLAGQLGDRAQLESVKNAMDAHTRRSLKEQDRLDRRFSLELHGWTVQ
jgi:hypothetical protein